MKMKCACVIKKILMISKKLGKIWEETVGEREREEREGGGG